MVESMSIKIGNTFKKLLNERRVTLKEVTKATGVASSTLSEWLNNRSPKNPEHIRKVAKFLGVSMHFFLFGEEDTEEPLHKLLSEDVFNGTFEINIKRVKIQKNV